ncbi:proline--tRNA ligase [Caldilinea sp.]|uniref:proline--tRNA ligase n=1 Tax=Caldilinea sp. TaxID=2293560 RepID=UPI002C00D71C|nr:proline--tRNA ligase [Caldilinea sp.]
MANEQALISRTDDFNEWYNSLVLRAEMADYGPVRGTMIVRPYGWALWENVQQALDRRFKATGHENAGFPMLIPMSFFEKEASHVEGFAPELAVVTHGGGEKLAEPLAIRPTSETIIGHTYARWIQSYRDLPILINLWNSVIRWEMRTKLFLRTLEFYWQEGHTAHATSDEALEETQRMLDVYADFAINDAAIPVIRGEKSEKERFAGAQMTLTIEAMMGDGKALQSGTSHYMGQNFARAFDIKFLDPNNEQQYCYTTSWGLSTRFVGAIIMTHGDDKGLVLPPKLAPLQVVIVPIYKGDAERAPVLEAAAAIKQELIAQNLRVKLDDRDNLTPGFKFNEWELKGVPVRIEIGPRDLQSGTVMVGRRDIPGREGKQISPRAGLAQRIDDLLAEIQANLLARATQARDERITDVTSYEQLKEAINTGFARGWWAGACDDEEHIQAETKATLRCIPLEQPDGDGTCFYTGKPATKVAIFGRSY